MVVKVGQIWRWPVAPGNSNPREVEILEVEDGLVVVKVIRRLTDMPTTDPKMKVGGIAHNTVDILLNTSLRLDEDSRWQLVVDYHRCAGCDQDVADRDDYLCRECRGV